MKKYRDEIAELCHEIVEDGYRLGMISDADMRDFEEDCFVHEPEMGNVAKKSLKMEHLNA